MLENKILLCFFVGTGMEVGGGKGLGIKEGREGIRLDDRKKPLN